jgi:hypothetical protein
VTLSLAFSSRLSEEAQQEEGIVAAIEARGGHVTWSYLDGLGNDSPACNRAGPGEFEPPVRLPHRLEPRDPPSYAAGSVRLGRPPAQPTRGAAARCASRAPDRARGAGLIGWPRRGHPGDVSGVSAGARLSHRATARQALPAVVVRSLSVAAAARENWWSIRAEPRPRRVGCAGPIGRYAPRHSRGVTHSCRGGRASNLTARKNDLSGTSWGWSGSLLTLPLVLTNGRRSGS